MMILESTFQSSDFNIWHAVVQFGIVSSILLVANVIRRKTKLFRNLLFPTAIIGGFIGLGLKYIIFGLNLQIEGTLILTNEFLETITYHTIALGFIAMGLKSVKQEDTKEVKGRPFKTGLIIANTYLIQGIVGLGLSIFLALFFTKLPAYSGILMPLGFGQGPGQAGNFGGVFETEGFIGGKSFGLSVATLGTLWACIAGIYYINKRAQKGKVKRAGEERSFDVTTEQVESREEIPISEAIDKMSIQIILVVVVYLFSYLAMKGITSIPFPGDLSDTLNNLIWGFNFMFGMLFAMIAKQILKGLRKAKLMKRKYTNEYMLNRITGVVFDFMIVASIMAIDIKKMAEPHLWISLLIISTVIGFLTYFFLKFTIKRTYPDYEHQAFASLFGTLTGTASNGIALLREVDPEFETPAADDLVTGSSTAIMFGFPLFLILGYIFQSSLYMWISFGVMIAIFSVFSYFLYRKEKPKGVETSEPQQ